jgi:hypothetical protein
MPIVSEASFLLLTDNNAAAKGNIAFSFFMRAFLECGTN